MRKIEVKHIKIGNSYRKIFIGLEFIPRTQQWVEQTTFKLEDEARAKAWRRMAIR